MTTLMIDPDDAGCMTGTRLPPPPDFVPPTIAESLARGFDDWTDFYVMDGKPIALWADWDSGEMHPFIPVIYGKEITETGFREFVKARHGLP